MGGLSDLDDRWFAMAATTAASESGLAEGRAAPKDRLGGRRTRILVLVFVWMVASAFYYWTATSSGDPIVFNTVQSDYYNQLTDGFLQGELSIPTVPPRALVDLPDPYNPVQNGPWQAQFHDLSLYHGHLYLSWGASPVITLFLPWHALGIGNLTENLAALIYAIVGLAFFLALLELLVTHYLRRAPPWKVALCGLALSGSSVVAYLLRRPLFYEVAIACSYCFIAAGLYFIALARVSTRRRSLSFAVGSLCLGIAVGARFETLLLGGVILAAAIEVFRSTRGRAMGRRLATVAPVVLPWCGATFLVLLYNFARFGNPFQIGSAYQLAGFDPSKVPYEQLGYVPPALYYYVFAPVRLVTAFPFIALPPPPFYPGGAPEAWTGTEIVAGVLWTTPILLALLAATFVLRRRLAELGWMVVVVSVIAVAMLGAIGFTVPGVTMRYEADYASLLLIGACVTWLAWEPGRRLLRAVIAAIGALFLLFGTVVGVAISITGPDDELMANNLLTYQSLENRFSFVNHALAAIDGRAEVVRIITPGLTYPQNLGDYGTYQPGTLRWAILTHPEELDINAPAAGVYNVVSRLERTASAPAAGDIEVYVQYGHVIEHQPLRYARAFSAPVQLQAGLNRIWTWVTFTGKQPPDAFPEIVNAYGVNVVRVAG